MPAGHGRAAIAAAFPPERCIELIREAARRPDLDVEILASNAFAFSAQVASRMRDGRVILVGDAAHRMTPRGGRGMNTAIADAYDLGWKLAWTVRGLAADDALLESYETERGPVGRRNVAMSMVPDGGGGSADGLFEDLGTVVRSSVIVDDGSPASVLGRRCRRLATCRMRGRAPGRRTRGCRSGSRNSASRRSTCSGARWSCWSLATPAHGGLPLPRWPGPTGPPCGSVASAGRLRDADGTFAATYGLSRRRCRAGPPGRRGRLAHAGRRRPTVARPSPPPWPSPSVAVRLPTGRSSGASPSAAAASEVAA